MPTRADYPIPPPTTWQEFENLCHNLWREIWKDSNTQKNGRQGQPQHGVDVYGQPSKKIWSGLQAKEKDQLPASTLTIAELRAEVEKAKGFVPALNEYILATTGPRDANVQREARIISDSNRRKGLFTVTVYSWKDIESLLKKHQAIYKLHYPQHFPDIDAIEGLTKKVLTEQDDNFDKTSEEIGALRFAVEKGFKHLGEQASVGGDVTQEHHAELDYARDLIDQHKPLSALKYLEPIKKRIWNNANANIKFRLLANIAAAKTQVGDYKEASQLFIEALQYNPDEEKALCNIALAYILLGKRAEAEEYIKKVLAKNPASGRAYSLLIQIHIDSSKPIEEIIKKIPSEYHELPEVLYGLGTAFRRAQRYSDALKWFKKLEKIKTKEPEYLMSLATTLFASISKDQHISFSKKLNKVEIQKVTEALTLYDQAWKEIKLYEDNSIKIECLVNRGIGYLLLGNLHEASRNFDEALLIEPDNPGYIFNRAYIDYELNKKDLALERLKPISLSLEVPAAILIGDIYMNNNDLDNLRNEAIPIIKNYLKKSPPSFFRTAAQRLLIQIYITLKEIKIAIGMVDELAAQDPTSINTLVSRSRVYRLVKNEKIADECLEEAQKLVTHDTTYFDLLALADEYNYIGSFEKASILYERVTDRSVDSELTRRLIDCYLKAGKNKEALTTCEAIRANQGFIGEILQLEVSLHEDIGDLANAEKLSEDYLKTNPNDAKAKLHLAAIYYRNQKWDKVDEFLKKPLDSEKLPLKYRIQYSELLSVRGFNEEAIKVMYEARRKYFDKSEAHLRYIATLFRTEDKNDEWLRPRKVSTDTAVLVGEDNGTKTWFLIENRTDVDSAKNELTPQHPLSLKLLDKTVGDTVELVSTGPQKRYGKILEIKSKYIYALHNSLSSYQTMFPEAEGLYRIEIKNNADGKIEKENLKVLFEQIDKQHEQYEMVMGYYREGKLTIGAMAKLLGRNPIEAWGLLVSSEDQELRCSVGDINLRRNAQESLSGKPKIVIDIFSLMTIHGLDVADQVVANFGKLLISQSTIDVITELISNRKGLFSKGFMTMGKQHGHYVKEEISAEQLNKNTEYLKQVIKWIENNCLIIPCREALKLKADDREKLYDLFGESFIDSILIAKQEDAILYSEDERLTSFATGTYGVQGIWTQVVLQQLFLLGALDNQKYQDFIIKLVYSNYVFISINADTLIVATKQSQWKADRSFIKLASLLNGSKCDVIPAAIVVSDYIHKLLNQPIYLDDPKNICFVVLDHAIMGRVNKEEFIKQLDMRLTKLFSLTPTKLRDVKQMLVEWIKTHIV